MGRQQSYAKFNDKEVLLKELNTYLKRDSKNDQTYVLGVAQCIKECNPFKKNELALILGGERYGQRSSKNLYEETGVANVIDIAFIDSVEYCMLAEEHTDGDLGKFLDEHFHYLNEEELKELGVIFQ